MPRALTQYYLRDINPQVVYLLLFITISALS